jgi:hypothetical protein
MEIIQTPFLPIKETVIYPVGDVQLGAPGFYESMFKSYIAEGIKRKAWFIGMGDYVDVASPSNRARYAKSELYDNFKDMVAQGAEEALRQFKHLVKGTEGRWLGLLEGHHYFEFEEDGTTTDTRLADYLRAPFLGTSAYVILRFQDQTSKSKRRVRFVIEAQHGSGGGIKTAAPINKLENLASGHEGVDLFLMGHQHKRSVAELSRMYPDRGKPPHITHRAVKLIATGSFLRGYLEGSKYQGRAQGDYVEKGMMNPVALGGVPIVIKPHYGKDKDLTLEVHAEV